MMIGLPVFAAFAIISVIGIYAEFGTSAFGLFANSIFNTTTTASLATIPAFILMGELLFRSGASTVLFDAVGKLIGRIPGRQFAITIVLGAILGALFGSAMAVAAMLGRSLLPEMERLGYDRKMASGAILAGAGLAPIIPPSILAIIAATLANVSISKLLLAGIVPGILLALIFFIYCFVKVSLQPYLAPDGLDGRVQYSGKEKLWALVSLLPFAATIFMVMGLILMGIATPTEAGATGVLGSLITAACYRNLNFKMILDALLSTARTTAMILTIMATATLFSQLLGFTGSMAVVTQAVVMADFGYFPMLFLMLAIPFVLCMFVDQIAIMLVMIPIYAPTIVGLGFDPIWFWTLFLIVISVGALTPPFGYALFVLKSTAPHVGLTEIYRASWPFVGLYLLGIALLAAVPEIVTFLPSLL
jgi:tripartite ATP-independent transporter DctM subunit